MFREYRNISTDDAYAAYDSDMYEFEKSRPICANCGEHIVDDSAYYIDNNWYCPDCVDEGRVYFD